MKKFIAPVLITGLMGAAEAKPIKGQICPTKVTGQIEKCKPGKRCTLDLKVGDVLSDIKYFGSKKCDQIRGFTKINVEQVDSNGVVLTVKGTVLPGLKRKFRMDFRKQSKRMKALGIVAGKTRNPKVARLILRR